jgi:hypothetical protein
MLEIGNRVRLSTAVREQGIWKHSWARRGTVWSVHTDGCILVKWDDIKKMQLYAGNYIEKIPESEQV